MPQPLITERNFFPGRASSPRPLPPTLQKQKAARGANPIKTGPVIIPRQSNARWKLLDKGMDFCKTPVCISFRSQSLFSDTKFPGDGAAPRSKLSLCLSRALSSLSEPGWLREGLWLYPHTPND